MLQLPSTRKALLDSGATLLYQRNPFSPTIAFSVYFTRGSRDETSSERGMTHLLEHMVFRGTKNRSALDIAFTLESIGGQWDAFTSKESTCFHGKVLEDHFETLTDVFADIVLNPAIPEDAFRLERRIVQEEIRSVKDSPEEATHELFFESLFRGHPLGYPITGYQSDVAKHTRRRLTAFHKKVYAADAALIGFIGNIPFRKVAASVEDKFIFPRRGVQPGRRSTTVTSRRRRSLQRPSWKQTHVCIGTTTVSASSRERHALGLLANILGGGVSSRFFQSMREETGLVYSVFTQTSFWRDTGVFWTFFSVDPKNLPQALEIYRHELDQVQRGEISDEEIDSAKAQFKGSIIFGIENIESRLFRLLRSEFYHGRYVTPAEVVRSIERVNRRVLTDVARRYLDGNRLTYVSQGPATLKKLVP
ncbi:MAG: insulinase family protein [bacterium]|nr:MAG: insulinase family protein [bacterium]